MVSSVLTTMTLVITVEINDVDVKIILSDYLTSADVLLLDVLLTMGRTK